MLDTHGKSPIRTTAARSSGSAGESTVTAASGNTSRRCSASMTFATPNTATSPVSASARATGASPWP